MTVSTAELLRLLRGRLPAGEELEAVRVRRLRALVRFAYGNVAYYRRLFDAAGLRPDDIRTVEDLRHVPISTRDELRAAGPDGLARGADLARGAVAPTSGSSGRPWEIFRTRHEARLHRATEFRSMRWAGLRPSDRIATLGHTVPVPRPLHESLGFYRTTFVPSLLPIEEQIRRVREVRPSVLWVYPTALRALLRETGSLVPVAQPRLMIHSAEVLDDPLRRQACEGLSMVTRNFYGAVECGRIAWECAAGEGLHINADCVIVEAVDDAEVVGGGKSVVLTNLNSHAMPFIRYRLGDRCELMERPCSCGVPLPLMKPPTGRDWDVVQLPSGKLLSPFIFTFYLRAVPGLRQFRLIQKRVDWIVLQLRFANGPEPGSLAALRQQLERQMAEPVTLDLEPVDALEDGRLKFRSFISEVSRG